MESEFRVVSDEDFHERAMAAKHRDSLDNKKTYHCEDCNREIYIRKYDNFADDVLILHHIIRLLDGGTSDKDNLMKLCKYCHKARHAEMMIKPQLPLFRKRRIIGYRKGGVYTELPT